MYSSSRLVILPRTPMALVKKRIGRTRSCEGLGKSARGSVTRTRERRKMKVLWHEGTSILHE